MIGLPSLAQLDQSSSMRGARMWLAAMPADMRCGDGERDDRAGSVSRRRTACPPRDAPRSDPEHFGAVPIDNNASEREMKRIVLNRKNSLFVGIERAGHTAAVLSSLASTCRRHDLDPQRYLTQLLLNLPATPASQIDQWLPDQCKRRDPHPPT